MKSEGILENSQIVFLDMDEVLVDFVGPAAEAHGTTRAEIEGRMQPGAWWDMREPLGLSSLTQFWKPIRAMGVEFWETLVPHPWWEDLLNAVESMVDENWYLVSAPTRCPTSYVGKVNWITKYLGTTFDRYLLTPHKELLAKEGRILVDDRPENCDKFFRAGGKSILFPFHGNASHPYLNNPVSYVRQVLEHYLGAT